MSTIEPGIFETIFPRPRFEASLDAVAALGLGWVQFDLASTGLPTLPAEIPAALGGLSGLTAGIRRACAARGVQVAALAGTYNMVHPDPAVRAAGLAGLRTVCAAAREIGAPVVTLCTGTRDPGSMWRAHPDNRTPAAWADLRRELAAALALAEEHGVVLGAEPEPANVAGTAALARDLLDELDHPRLKIVLDPANVLAADRDRPAETVLEEAFALLGPDIVLAHAKDLMPQVEGARPDAEPGFGTAGTGVVPWDRCIALFREVGFGGPLILHTLTEAEAPGAVAFLRGRVAVADGRGT